MRERTTAAAALMRLNVIPGAVNLTVDLLTW